MNPKVRFSIAGLLLVFLLAALGVAGWRHPGETWDGGVFLLTCGILALAVVGVACQGGAARAWWFGFALFGWGYLAVVFSAPHAVVLRLPTSWFLKAVQPYIEEPGQEPMRVAGGRIVHDRFQPDGMGRGIPSTYGMARWRIGHCLWSLLAAVLGGELAVLLFAVPADRKAKPVAGPQPMAPAAPKWWRRPALIGLAGLVLFASCALVAIRWAPDLCAGATYLLIWQLLGLAALGAVYDQGERRATWLGATLFGAGTMMLLFGPGSDQPESPRSAANSVLNALRARLPAIVTEPPAAAPSGAANARIKNAPDPSVEMQFPTADPAEDAFRLPAVVTAPRAAAPSRAANARIREALDRPVPMRFPNETPLEDVLKFIAQQTEGPDGSSIAIYLDPAGLKEAEKTATSPVCIDLEGVALKTTLELVLKQLRLTYRVRDGVLIITAEHPGDPSPANEDPFLLCGNSLLALLAAGLGGVLAPSVAGRGSE